jgi:hypothetical protein
LLIVKERGGSRSLPHPFIARIPLAFALLLPLPISLLLCPFLGTALLPVPLLFLIHLLLVWGGMIDVWRPRTLINAVIP